LNAEAASYWSGTSIAWLRWFKRQQGSRAAGQAFSWSRPAGITAVCRLRIRLGRQAARHQLSALGQKQTCELASATSALPPKADMRTSERHLCKVARAEMPRCCQSRSRNLVANKVGNKSLATLPKRALSAGAGRRVAPAHPTQGRQLLAQGDPLGRAASAPEL
jgi:hypothetical protein